MTSAKLKQPNESFNKRFRRDSGMNEDIVLTCGTSSQATASTATSSFDDNDTRMQTSRASGTSVTKQSVSKQTSCRKYSFIGVTPSTNQATRSTSDSNKENIITNGNVISNVMKSSKLSASRSLSHVNEASVDKKRPSSSKASSKVTQTASELCQSKQVTQNYPTLHNMLPTEAQLRWVQFQQKHRSQVTNSLIKTLMQYPLEVNQVDDYQSGDGDSYTSYESEICVNSKYCDENEVRMGDCPEDSLIASRVSEKSKKCNRRKKRKNKKIPPLSRGRRALLRVSVRKTEERRLYIKQNGFTMMPDDDEKELVSNQLHQLDTSIDYSIAPDDITDALDVTIYDGGSTLASGVKSAGLSGCREAGIIGRTIQGSKKKKKINGRRKRFKGRRSIVHTADEDEERVRRFEEAYRTMCSVSVSPEEGKHESLIKTSKRWTRASHIPVAVSIDGRKYDDLQRSPSFKHSLSSRRYGAETVRAALNGIQLADRSASWLTHLPTKLRTNEGKTSPNNFTQCTNVDLTETASPGKQKFMELMNRLRFTPKEKTDAPQYCSSQTIYNNAKTHSQEGQRMGIDKMRHLVQNTKKIDDAVEQKAIAPLTCGVDVKCLQDQFLGGHHNIETKKSVSTIRSEQPHSKVFGVATRYIMGLRATKSDQSKESNPSSFRTMQLSQIEASSTEPDFKKKIMKIVQQTSHNTAQVASNNSVIDTDNNTAISEGMDPARVSQMMSTLMLSPMILTKRLNQAILAVESHNWEQVAYLLSANPWLAEMVDVNTDQYLLHKLASHGGENGGNFVANNLNDDLINAFPASVHKYDKDGNLPLHMASAARNTGMILRLGELFPSGFSVRNFEGRLPLHLYILGCSRCIVFDKREEAPSLIVREILEMFPTALVVSDNDGNLPIHLAASYLKGDIGMEVIRILQDEAIKHGEKLRLPSGTRMLKETDENESIITEATVPPSETGIEDNFTPNIDSGTRILFAKNGLFWTPLMCAVKNKAGWQVIEELLSFPGIERIIFDHDENDENIIQLTIGENCCDPLSVLSILKAFPQLATIKCLTPPRVLPIEFACLKQLQPEVIMAIALVDLPINLDAKDNLMIREGYGASWWYLTCDCDDAYVDIVVEILTICTYAQKRELCFLKNKLGSSVIKRASPKCKLELRKALRFAGRYEFTGNAIVKAESVEGIKVFEVLDFGTDDIPIENGRSVYLKYYEQFETYARDTAVLQDLSLSDERLARVHIFCVNTLESYAPDKYCVAVEKECTTLAKICLKIRRDKKMSRQNGLNHYTEKIRQVLRRIGNGINVLHKEGVVHGSITMDACGKFEDGWKLTNLLGAQGFDQELSFSRFQRCAAPELVKLIGGRKDSKVTLCQTILASYALDIWAFGKLMYEALVGKPLLVFRQEDTRMLQELRNWDEDNLRHVITEVETYGIGTVGADLISHCLCPYPEDRPESMEEILDHPFWKSSSKSRNQMLRRFEA